MKHCKRKWLVWLGLSAAWWVGGCAGGGVDDGFDLAMVSRSPVVEPAERWRRRVDPRVDLDKTVSVSLGWEYELIFVRDREGWDRLWRALGTLPVRGRAAEAGREASVDGADEKKNYGNGIPAAPDFSRGSVVGLLARLGEPVDGSWPLRLEGGRVVEGVGLVEANVEQGAYYPIIGPSFLEMGYFGGLERLVMVRIGQERFLFERK